MDRRLRREMKVRRARVKCMIEYYAAAAMQRFAHVASLTYLHTCIHLHATRELSRFTSTAHRPSSPGEFSTREKLPERANTFLRTRTAY